ncbi:hypothetical protein DFH11DRAFT_1542062 [Phellopilus nigrolimitatus]|nr:hypothetical protein DFH11DRAFT_1542062 [Phellopilus nigrolimitatus]
MAVSTSTAGQAKKRNHPPSFQHLPRDRATKLKKAWVEKKKLKSQWKAQQRKEGIVLNRERRPPPPSQDRGAVKNEEGDEEEGNELEDAPREESGDEVESSDDAVAESGDGEPAHLSHPQPPSNSKPSIDPPAHSGRRRPANGDKNKNEDGSERGAEKLSVRELTRQAYSRASLHTFRADPLHRRAAKGAGSGSASTSSRGRGVRGGPRGGMRGGSRGSRKSSVSGGGGPVRSERGGRGGFGGRGRGREHGENVAGEARGGQPNMKLRMEAMLERIKQDYT